MKLGVFGLTPPAEVPPDQSLGWVLEHASGLGVQVVGGDSRAMFGWGTFKVDRGRWRELRARAAQSGVQIEPFVRCPFDLVGSGAKAARQAVLESMAAAKDLGGPVLRTAYGDQTLARTRFGSADLPGRLASLAANLREADRLAASEGVTLAIENHTDFSGREWASVFESVGSDRIACAFDCANGLTIFSDPADDLASLAPWSVTTHIKDLEVVENPRPAEGFSAMVPFGLRGCALGDGVIDIQRVIKVLFATAKFGAETPLIVEPSWPAVAPGEALAAKRNDLVSENLRRLTEIAARLDGEAAAR